MSVKIKCITVAAFFSALMCFGSWLKIPFFPVPLTLQFFFLNTAILMQKPMYSTLSISAYIFLGLAGLPVFSGGGGPAYILSPTFGYIIGFFLAAALSGTFISTESKVLHSLINLLVIYICGLSYLYLMSNCYLGNRITLSKTLIYGCLIFLPSDIIEIIISCTVVKKFERHYGLIGAAGK
jgi:biotin transport system substrate-specific component